MDFLLLPAEVQLSLIAIFVVASIGCIAAIRSWLRISKEAAGVAQAESILTGEEAWNDAYPHDKLKLATWLRENGIKPDSHVGDFIRTCWSAWLGGRPASLTELHVLVARRERGHRSTRLSAGISALLLVFGIIGTLSSIKPVLQDFKFQIEKETANGMAGDETELVSGGDRADEEQDIQKDASSVMANTELVNNLIHNLGNAFWPSLLALFGTIAVVSFRGLYSMSLHKFVLDLDRFAVDVLIPRYRVPSLSEQYQEVKATLATVTANLIQRDGRFHQAVEQLENLVIGISPALNGLNAAVITSNNAAEKLASGAESIAQGLNRHLGEKSPMHRAVKGLASVFEQTETSVGNLSSMIEGIGKSNTTYQDKFGSAIQTLGDSIETIGKDHKSRNSEDARSLKDFKEKLDNIPAAIQATGEKAVEAGLSNVKSLIEELHVEQKKWHFSSAEELKTATMTSVDAVTKAGQDLAVQAQKVATAAKEVQGIKPDVSVAQKKLAESGKSRVSPSGAATKSKIETDNEKLSVEDEIIGKPAELLHQIQDTSSPHSDLGSWAPTENKVPTGSDYGDDQESFTGTTSPLSLSPVFTTPTPSAVMVPARTVNQQAGDPRNTKAVVPNNEYSPHQPPLSTGQHRNTLVSQADEPDSQQKGKMLSRFTNLFTRKRS
jgi:hypothetical protein